MGVVPPCSRRRYPQMKTASLISHDDRRAFLQDAFERLRTLMGWGLDVGDVRDEIFRIEAEIIHLGGM